MLFIYGCAGSLLLHRLFSGCGKKGLLFIVVCRLLIEMASLVVNYRLSSAQTSVAVAHGLSSSGSQTLEHRFNSFVTWAQLLCSMWDPPRPGIKPVSPALAGILFTTEPLGKPFHLVLTKAKFLQHASQISKVLISFLEESRSR